VAFARVTGAHQTVAAGVLRGLHLFLFLRLARASGGRGRRRGSRVGRGNAAGIGVLLAGRHLVGGRLDGDAEEVGDLLGLGGSLVTGADVAAPETDDGPAAELPLEILELVLPLRGACVDVLVVIVADAVADALHAAGTVATEVELLDAVLRAELPQDPPEGRVQIAGLHLDASGGQVLAVVRVIGVVLRI